MMSNCKLCLADCVFKGKDMKKGNCKGYIPMSNADRLSAMSDEELAAYLAEISGGTILKTFKQLGLSLSDEKSKKYLNELTAEYLKRLQQPAEED